MKVLSTASEIGQQVHNAKSTGKIVGLVPTMGALHQGHVSLVTQARRECDLVVVSIFVNPTQFNDPQDFSNYPRDLTTDVQILKQAGCDIAFTPGYDEVYPTPDDRQYFFGDLETRFGLASVRFDDDVPEPWKPYYRRMLARSLGDLQRVMPTISVRGLNIHIGELPIESHALALHEPRGRDRKSVV